MARFFGKVGYALGGHLVNGVWTDNMTERPYYGDVLNDTQTHEQSDKVNDDLRLSSRISIMADAFALENRSKIKYVVDESGAFWAVTSVELKRPRLILSTGGVYSGKRPTPDPVPGDS